MESAKRIYADYESTVARLYDTEFLGQQVNMQQVSEAVGNIVDSIIRNPDACTLLHKMKRKGDYLYNHAIGMSVWAAALSRQIGLPPNEIKRIAMGALLCDIGKVGISSRILDKPGKPSEQEFETIKTHPQTGARILEPIEEYTTIIPIILQHHERFDGKGYPYGLSGKSIHFGARILAVADAFDAMKSDRPYRDGMPLERVMGIIQQESGRQFDPVVAEALVNTVYGRASKAA